MKGVSHSVSIDGVCVRLLVLVVPILVAHRFMSDCCRSLDAWNLCDEVLDLPLVLEMA